MANLIEKQTIQDGERNLVLKIHIDGDGSGEETSTLLIDVSSYAGSPTELVLKEIKAGLTGFSLELLWDATTDVHLFNVPDFDVDQSFDTSMFSGIPNNAGTGKTGDINFTTVGLGATDTGHIWMWFIKKYD